MTRTGLQRFNIRCRTTRLDNGLQVVVHEDHGSPVVAVHLMYHVGSRNEPEGRTGLAHLLEHLLFEGTEHCPKGAFDTLLEHVGGTNNGSTWLDRTNYYETVPTHATELALWLERERLAHFLPVLDRERLELQRGVVINERLQTAENRPYGLADERLHQLLFPGHHPYSWPTIGWMPDLERISLADVRGFFEAHYTPGNATLVLAGDLEYDSALTLAARYFGDLPDTSNNRATAPSPELLNGGPRRDLLPDRVSFPRVYRAHTTPAYGTGRWNALDVLAYVLADGESSRLQRALVREAQLAQDADTYLLPTELVGVFGLVCTARDGVTGEAIEERIQSELERIVREGISADELVGAVRRIRRDQLAGLGNVEERAEALAYAATVLGEAQGLNRVMDMYLEVSVDDVVAATSEYLHDQSAATLVVIPSGEPPLDEDGFE